ncbi:hypothetical protein D9M71_588860 [compost metagenome]
MGRRGGRNLLSLSGGRFIAGGRRVSGLRLFSTIASPVDPREIGGIGDFSVRFMSAVMPCRLSGRQENPARGRIRGVGANQPSAGPLFSAVRTYTGLLLMARSRAWVDPSGSLRSCSQLRSVPTAISIFWAKFPARASCKDVRGCTDLTIQLHAV